MIGTLGSLLLAGTQYASIDIKLVRSGAASKLGFYFAQPLNLRAVPPEGIQRLAGGSAEYGSWSFGGKKVVVAEESRDGAPSGIDVDFQGRKNFKSALRVDWQIQPLIVGNPKAYKVYKATVSAPSPFGDGHVDINFYRFDPADPQRAEQKHELFYYANYALDGTATLGGQAYHVMITDTQTVGEFGEQTQLGELPASLLFIDRDGDGKFSRFYEMYDTNRPFNINGVTYELVGLLGNGSRVGVRRSSKSVAEIPMPLGTVATFAATDISGKRIHFPEDFKGKVVMLSFWATTCRPYLREITTQVEVYKKLHAHGFEILGVSLDDNDSSANIGPTMTDNGMTWDQIAERKGWGSSIGKLFGFQSIPQAYLVDGDTGKILAEGDSLRGESLLPAVQKALESKRKSSR